MTYSLQQIDNAAKALLQAIGNKKVIALHGSMGAGKTTLVQALCNAMQVTSNVSSPTFSIINEYHTAANDIVYHIDLYRLKSEREAINAGVEDCLYSGNLCLVEWPSITPNIFDENVVHCYIDIVKNNDDAVPLRSMKLEGM